jgi:DNA-binding NarL/FixJ family response regulator
MGLANNELGGRTQVLIADHAATRLGIRLALGTEVEICGEAGNSEEAIRAAERLQPAICLVGREIPGGLRAVRGICRAAPGAAVAVLAETPDEDDLLECIRAGAIGYVPGTLNADRLHRIIRALEADEAVVPRSMILELLLELRGEGPRGERLTRRESQVLRLLRQGHTTAAIAERLEVAPVTVRRHISAVVQKLGLEDRSRLTGSANPSGVSRGTHRHAKPRRTA